MVTPANDYIILVGNDWLRMAQSDLMLSRGISQTKSEHSKFLCEISGQLSNSLFCCDIARLCGGHCLLREEPISRSSNYKDAFTVSSR